MKDKKISIVITTINRPVVIEKIAENCIEFDRLKNVSVIIVGDKKTPMDVGEYVTSVAEATGLSVMYMGVSEQEAWLTRFPDLEKIIPFNSDNRRNIGHLLAYESGADIIVALDDDNFPLEGVDYFAPFLDVGEVKNLSLISSDSGWYNPCSELTSDCSMEYYPRGFPYSHRDKLGSKANRHATGISSFRLLVKAGLWLGDPDVDAVTRLAFPITVDGFSGEEIYLAPATLCPFNTQNTAIHRTLIPAFYYVLMDQMIDGHCIDRYGDIWSSYFAQKVMHHFGDVLGFGYPLVMHDRNEHDLLEDLRQEFPGMVLTNKLVELLKGITLTGSDYIEATYSLVHEIKKTLSFTENLTEEECAYLQVVTDNITIWLGVIERLDK